MKISAAVKAERWLVVAIVVLTSVGFWRGVSNSFDLTKATTLWLLSPVILILHLGISISRQTVLKRSDSIVMALMTALVMSSVISPRPWFAVFGQPQRFTGLITLLCCLTIYLAISRWNDGFSVLAWTMSAVSVPAITYTLLQSSGHDPYEWSINSFGKPIFSTIGNPNTASGFISCLLPFVLWSATRCKRRLQIAAWHGVAGSLSGVVGLLLSFQGQVVVFAVGISLAIRQIVDLFSRPGSSVQRLVTGLLMSVLVATGPIICTTTTHCLLLGTACLVVSLLHTGDSSTSWLRRSRSLGLDPRMMWLSLPAVLVMGVTIFIASWNWIEAQFAESLVERGDFYRAAWKLFLDHPIFGSGLENFGFYFTEYRSEGHALRLENSRTSSVHSIPLAMLSSGGVLLGLVFVMIVISVLVLAIRTFRRDPDDSLGYWLIVGWIAIVIQTSVSVEHVSLFLLFAVVAGLIVGRWRRAEERPGAGIRSRKMSRASLMVMSSLSILWFVAVIPLSAPLRANFQSLESQRSLYVNQDVRRGVEQLEKAVELAPWDFQYRYDLGFVLNQVGDTALASELLLRASAMSNYNPGISMDAATIAASIGRLEDARHVLIEASKRDPFARDFRARASDLMTQMAEALVGNGQLEDGRGFVADALLLDPSFAPAVELSLELD